MGKHRVLLVWILLSFGLTVPRATFAVRPFITDDARVTPGHTFLTETSLRLDQSRLQNLTLFALGLTDQLEGTIGFTDGILRSED
ncbi:MAG TPA: hypothetical protein VLS90_05045, partial [Thermodesulfobacteriota bacterium]|nr:hypothetical protein [Thermodesulfobacteriota bacterium]